MNTGSQLTPWEKQGMTKDLYLARKVYLSDKSQWVAHRLKEHLSHKTYYANHVKKFNGDYWLGLARSAVNLYRREWKEYCIANGIHLQFVLPEKTVNSKSRNV